MQQHRFSKQRGATSRVTLMMDDALNKGPLCTVRMQNKSCEMFCCVSNNTVLFRLKGAENAQNKIR